MTRRMRPRFAFALALALPLAPALHAQAAPATTVRTSLGLVAGLDTGGVVNWRGIPYAAPPVGERRWRPPAPAAAWTGTRDATQFGPACMQTDALAKLYGGAMEPVSEDCLTLNVWSAAPAGAKRPVLVWIHGGGFTHGTGRTSLYDGGNLARLGAVVVTINYRLGVFGYLAHPALSAEARGAGSGAYGFLDQVAALRWVKAEIAAFGGDPDNVAIFGESAGAFSVGYLLVAPRARGLFHRAILQSGSPMRFPLPLSAPDSAPSGERAGLRIARRAGITGTDAAALAALRALPADTLLARTRDVALADLPEVVDGTFLVEPPAAALKAGRVARVPVIIGSNADESTILVRSLSVRTEAHLDSAIRAAYPSAFADRVRTAYPPAGPNGPVRAYRQLWSDDVFTAPARETARALADAGVPVYRYYYTRVGSGMTGLALGAFHASEIPFVFGVRGTRSPIWGESPADSALATTMSGAWVQFARTGDPNGAGLPAWPRFTRAGDEAMEFGARIGAAPGPRPGPLDLIAEILDFRVRTSAAATIRAESAK